MRVVWFLIAAIVAAWLAVPASASVRKIALTSPVVAGSDAQLTVAVKPRARCTIKVLYETRVSEAAGLLPKTGTRITWRWKVGSSTHGGRWPIIVDCGKSGRLRLTFRVIGR